MGQLEGTADHILIDKMNYMNSIIGFYRRHNLEPATTHTFFREHKNALVADLKRRKTSYKVVF